MRTEQNRENRTFRDFPRLVCVCVIPYLRCGNPYRHATMQGKTEAKGPRPPPRRTPSPPSCRMKTTVRCRRSCSKDPRDIGPRDCDCRSTKTRARADSFRRVTAIWRQLRSFDSPDSGSSSAVAYRVAVILTRVRTVLVPVQVPVPGTRYGYRKKYE